MKIGKTAKIALIYLGKTAEISYFCIGKVETATIPPLQ